MQIQEIDIRKSADAYLEFYKALTSGDTGFPEIPPEVARDIVEIIWKRCFARQLFPWIKMDSDTVKYYVEAGTVEVYAPASEGAQVSESKITFGTPIELVAKEIRAWSSITDVASEEAKIDVIARTVMHIGKKFAECEEKNVLTGAGDGSDAYNLFKGVSKYTAAEGAQVVDKAKAAISLDDVNAALSYFEDSGFDVSDLVLLMNPYAARYLRKALSELGLDTLSAQTITGAKIPTLYGMKVVETGFLARRQYNPPTDTTLVSDVVVVHIPSCVGGDRRTITVERDRDIIKGLTIVAASERFTWMVLRPAGLYIIKNVLSQ